MNVLDRIKHELKDKELENLIMEVLNYNGKSR